MAELYILGGPNGAGKTTTALKLLPDFLSVYEFVNADAIASGLSPLRPEGVAFQAGRLMLRRLDELVEAGADFSFESTLSSRTFVPFVEKCRSRGYTVKLLYVWLQSPELAVARVASRVRSGGHFVPDEIIRRRYEKGRQNFNSLYLPLADEWSVSDNSGAERISVASGGLGRQTLIDEPVIWERISS